MHIAGLSIMPASWAPQQKKSSWLVSYSNEGEGDTTDWRLPFIPGRFLNLVHHKYKLGMLPLSCLCSAVC